jgi:hypothetical protein
VARRKKTPERPASPFRLRKILIVIGICAVFAVWIAMRERDQPSGYHSLKQIVAPSLQEGYAILEPPDLPGPYRPLGEGIPVIGGGLGRVTAGGKSRTYEMPEQANRLYLCINLATQDDRPTYALLYKDLPSQEEETRRLQEILDDKDTLEKKGP